MPVVPLILAVVGLVLLRPALRLGIALVEGRRIGAQVAAAQPERIHLVEAGVQDWLDPAASERLREPLLHLGYEPAGIYKVPEMPGTVLRLLVHLRERLLAVIYEHPQAGTWMDLAARHADGSSFCVTSCVSQGLAQRPECPVLHLPGTGPDVLHSRMLALRPNKERVAVEASQAAARFEEAYAEGVAWRKAHGVSRGEVVKAAVLGPPRNKAAA